MPLFKNREDAGKNLVKKLANYKAEHPIVLALPRGGVAVGFEVAKGLNAFLDVLVVRKLGAPGNPEFGIGAIAEGGIKIINEREVRLLGITEEELGDIIVEEASEMERRIALYRGNRHNPQVQGRTVNLVDDGLATGVTARAAIASIRLEKPKRLVFALPVCAKDAVLELRTLVDELICLHELEDFFAVGLWYEDFPQLNDEEVVNLIQQAHRTIVPK